MSNMTEIRYIDRKTGTILTEDTPGERWLRFLYRNPLGKLPLHAFVKRKGLSALYGRLMDSPRSRAKIAPFVKRYGISMEESVKSVDAFSSFNDFFSRKLKADARPVAGGEERLVSPADGKILAFERFSDIGTLFVKGRPLTAAALFGEEETAERYREGALILIRLAPVDYHRFHFPLAGLPGPAEKIPGAYFSVSPWAVGERVSIFCENKRELTLLETKTAGVLAIFEIGATMVGAVTQTFTPGIAVNKGREKGYFSFGGSTVILVAEKDAVVLDDDLLDNTKKGLETKVLMGEGIGKGLRL
ncbi:MAG: phosphatidylserine decarboxylase [Fusobacteriaceae bacterium]|nr:phosphatidylserine decarboxylase [Fusobacteriaceae bacterium]